MTDTATPTWVPPALLMGGISGALYFPTHYVGFAAIATVLFLAAGVGGLARVVKPTAAQPDTAATTSLVGARIHWRGGVSTVTADPDVPQPRRTVTAFDGHGRVERICVGVDASGRVTEACRPGEEWAGAETV